MRSVLLVVFVVFFSIAESYAADSNLQQHCENNGISNLYDCACIGENEAMLRQHATDRAMVADEDSPQIAALKRRIDILKETIPKTDNPERVAAMENNIAILEERVAAMTTPPDPRSHEPSQLYAYFNSKDTEQASLCRSKEKAHARAVEDCGRANATKDSDEVALYCDCVGYQVSEGWVNPTPQKLSWQIIYSAGLSSCGHLIQR